MAKPTPTNIRDQRESLTNCTVVYRFRGVTVLDVLTPTAIQVPYVLLDVAEVNDVQYAERRRNPWRI